MEKRSFNKTKSEDKKIIPTLYIIKGLIKLSLIFLLVACNTLDKEVKEVINIASIEQRENLSGFIKQFSDTENLEIAKFLIANLSNKYSIEGCNNIAYQTFIDSIDETQTINNHRNYNYRAHLGNKAKKRTNTKKMDLNILNVDSLKYQTDVALMIWNHTAWSSLYSSDVFKQYIVPYRIADEPLEYNWRMDAYSRYNHLLGEIKYSSIVAICDYIYQHIDYRTNNLFWGEPLQSYSANVKYKTGTCSDYAVYTAMVMRSLGIPTSIDFIPYWGDGNNGHSFNSLLLPDGSCKGYDNKGDIKNGLTLSGKVPKIYRKVYEIQRNSLLYRNRKSEFIPNIFAQYDLVDVTEQYNIPVTSLTISSLLYKPQSKIAFLSVFSPKEWRPVAWTEYSEGQANFKNVGVGYLDNEQSSDKGQNYGIGCLYLPICYINEEAVPLHYPFILKAKSAPRYLIPDKQKMENVTLYRKFPRKRRIIEFAKKMEGGYFEVSNDRNFKKSSLIYFVNKCPNSHLQKIPVHGQKMYRYMRYYKHNGGISISELGCLDENNRLIEGKIIAESLLMGDADLKNISDGDPLSYFDIGDLKDIWVGLDFGKPQKISTLLFCPRTDNNDVSPGDEYELFYWDKSWVSLGKQIAQQYSITYKNIPSNALLLLRNLTKGVEERPFTYEHNTPIWW